MMEMQLRKSELEPYGWKGGNMGCRGRCRGEHQEEDNATIIEFIKNHISPGIRKATITFRSKSSNGVATVTQPIKSQPDMKPLASTEHTRPLSEPCAETCVRVPLEFPVLVHKHVEIGEVGECDRQMQ